MASFDDHIAQAKSNLQFLTSINQSAFDHVDWQVTVCFYTAVHLINSHLATFNLQYRSHSDVKDAINPENPMAIAKLPEDQYVAYIALQQLSRRSRYLVNTKDRNIGTERAYLTYEKHLARSIRHLDKIIGYFNKTYNANIPKVHLSCSLIQKNEGLEVINVV